MAVYDLWLSVRTAASLSSTRAAVDSPRLDATRIEKILSGATFWLSPKAVEGYDPETFDGEFDFLPEKERKDLKTRIERFLRVAREVPGNQPATANQVERGLPEFTRIVEVFRPDQYADFDAFVVGKKIQKAVADNLPNWVREMVFETGDDSSGAPAIWIWVEVEDEAAEEATFYENFFLFKSRLEAVVRKISPELWPYIRMRTVSEQRPQVEPRRKVRSRKQ
jgi:hypothetical protein